MAAKQGFTLMEIIVTLTIVGITSTIVLTAITASVEQTKAQAAKSNLLAIAAAEQRYYEDNGAYCLGGCNFDSTLRLSIPSSDPFVYTCIGAPAPYSCTANEGGAGLFVLTLNVNTTANQPGVSVSCTTTPNPGYCPS